MDTPIFAFDFSIAKPAMAAYVNGELTFWIWPADIDSYTHCALQDSGINVTNRCIPKMKKLDEHSLILTHVTRAVKLADMITKTITDILDGYGITDRENVIISNEGFAFSAKGDATLDLSGYKYILMKALMDAGFRKFNTYSPTSIKSVAGCGKKGMGTKENMIAAFGNYEKCDHPFREILQKYPERLKKKTAFVNCVDDIADAFWCLMTTLTKENIKCPLNE